MPSVAVIGASHDRAKYGNKAVRAYTDAGWVVYPVNIHEQEIEGISAFRSVSDIPEKIDRIALYVPPAIGLTLLPAIASAKPREFFCNPGSESDALIAQAKLFGLQPILACAIIDIGKSPRSYY